MTVSPEAMCKIFCARIPKHPLSIDHGKLIDEAVQLICDFNQVILEITTADEELVKYLETSRALLKGKKEAKDE